MTDKEKQAIYEAGFEDGVGYAFGHFARDKFDDEELTRFASWAELKCPWLSMSEWYHLIKRHYYGVSKKDTNA